VVDGVRCGAEAGEVALVRGLILWDMPFWGGGSIGRSGRGGGGTLRCVAQHVCGTCGSFLDEMEKPSDIC